MLEVKILGNQPEPTLVNDGMTISDFEVRTKSELTFEQGKEIIARYIKENPALEGCEFDISDPMTVGIYPMPSMTTPGEFNFDGIVAKLESIGFYGKAAGYYTPQLSFDF